MMIMHSDHWTLNHLFRDIGNFHFRNIDNPLNKTTNVFIDYKNFLYNSNYLFINFKVQKMKQIFSSIRRFCFVS